MNIQIANRLVELRKKNGYSQEELAELLGLSRQAVSKWERAESSPDTDNLINLSRIYQVSLDELLSTEDEIPEPKAEKEPQNEDWETERKFIWQERTKRLKDEAVAVGGRIAKIHTSIVLSIVAIYIIMGFVWELWHPGWIVFLLIPLLITLLEGIVLAKRKGRASIAFQVFCYPVLVVAVYLSVCFQVEIWHPLWIIFLTVPIYYTLTALPKKREKEKVI